MVPFQIKANVLADTRDRSYPAGLEGRGYFPRRRLQRLRLLPQPDGLDDISGKTTRQSPRNGFNLRQLRHTLLVYKARRGRGFASGGLAESTGATRQG